MHKVPEIYDVTTRKYDAFCVKWQDENARYHVWMKGVGQINGRFDKEAVVFKNPLRNVEFRAEDWFDTRVMDLNTKAWSAVREWLLGLSEGEFEAAALQMRIEENRAERQRAAERRDQQITDLNDILHDLYPCVTITDIERLNEQRLTEAAS